MKLKHHLFRIISSIILVAVFIYIGTKLNSWFWIGIECAVMLLLCGIVIHIDAAHEYPDEL